MDLSIKLLAITHNDTLRFDLNDSSQGQRSLISCKSIHSISQSVDRSIDREKFRHVLYEL